MNSSPTLIPATPNTTPTLRLRKSEQLAAPAACSSVIEFDSSSVETGAAVPDSHSVSTPSQSELRKSPAKQLGIIQISNLIPLKIKLTPQVLHTSKLQFNVTIKKIKSRLRATEVLKRRCSTALLSLLI